tara:strand:+ start:4702 stop:5613 length:912 start_codon:yes stop_codon:yes gene_type:complete
MLEVSNLSKTYPGGIKALQSVSLSAGKGILGLLGPNGAGKSTLMRTLATLQLPDSGSASLDSLDLLNEPAEARRRIGYLPQEFGAYPRVSAREMLQYLAALRGIPADVRNKLVDLHLARVNLSDAADRRVDTYSHGMRQRFGIAAAFLGNPDLVIVDEPTAGLDPTERRRFQCLLAEAAKDCVMILSSHIVEDIEGLCGQVAIMAGGKIVLNGNPRELVDDLAGKVWSKSVSAGKEIAAMEREYRLLARRPEFGRIALRVFAGDGKTHELKQAGFEEGEPDLEDVFAMHTGESNTGFVTADDR